MAGNQINIVGWYNKRNAGDESYKLAFPKLLDLPLVFSDTPIADCDQYILGGGDIVAPCFLDQLDRINAPKHLMSVSVPEKVNGDLLKQFSTVIVRDEQSLTNALVSCPHAVMAPDFAFALQGSAERGKIMLRDCFLRENSEMYNNVIGLIINAHLMPTHESNAADAAYFERFCYDLSKVMDNTNASFILIPFGKAMPWDDRAANAMIASRCKFYKKNACIYSDLHASDALDIIAALDCVISTRLHSTIFAISNSTPFVDITHNHKNKNLLKTLDYEKSSIAYRQASSEEIKNRVNECIKNKDEIRKELLLIAEKQRASLQEAILNVHLV